MDLPAWVPEGVDVTTPNAARMYDYALGGFHNFPVDRDCVEQTERMVPGATVGARANRAFVVRAVRWLVQAGVRQFLDIGSGIPTVDNVHEVAQQEAPTCRVMYVDIDPVAVAHSREILADNPTASVIRADLRQATDILCHADVLDLLDFSQPVAVLLNAVLHFISDDHDIVHVLTKVRETLVSGSFLTISHGTPVPGWEKELNEVRNLYQRTPSSFYSRTRHEVLRFIDGWELVEPGITTVAEWHVSPGEIDDAAPHILAVVARLP